MGIGVSGLVSGLDTDSIISQLMELERRPIVQLQNKEAGYQAKITALGTVKSSMSDLQGAITALKDPDDLLSYSAISSNTDILNVTSTTEAQPGSYNITVSQLASAQQIKSAAFSSSSTPVGEGTISIKVGDGSSVDITIDTTNNTLSGIANAINESGAEVTASVIDDGNGNFYLALQSQKTGAANTISVNIQDSDGTNDDSSGLSALYSDPSTGTFTETQAALNAQLSVNGIDVERSENRFDDLISGVSIELKKADPTQSVTLTVDKDYSGIKSKLNNFIEKYNSLVDTLKEQTFYNPATQEKGTLLGDGAITRISYRLSQMIYQQVDGVNSEVNSLSKIGIEVDDDGHLSLNEGKLNTALETHAEDVISLFTKDDTTSQGIALQFDSFLDSYLKSSTGILSAKEDGLQSSIDSIEEQIERMNIRLDKREENLRHQFNNLENLLAQFQDTSGQLEQQLASIQNLNAQISKG